MPKKVVIVSSSPRKDGNSDILAQEFARGACAICSLNSVPAA